jgi:hypothetical protein
MFYRTSAVEFLLGYTRFLTTPFQDVYMQALWKVTIAITGGTLAGVGVFWLAVWTWAVVIGDARVGGAFVLLGTGFVCAAVASQLLIQWRSLRQWFRLRGACIAGLVLAVSVSVGIAASSFCGFMAFFSTVGLVQNMLVRTLLVCVWTAAAATAAATVGVLCTTLSSRFFSGGDGSSDSRAEH